MNFQHYQVLLKMLCRLFLTLKKLLSVIKKANREKCILMLKVKALHVLLILKLMII